MVLSSFSFFFSKKSNNVTIGVIQMIRNREREREREKANGPLYMHYLADWAAVVTAVHHHCGLSPNTQTHTDHRQDTFNRANGFLMKNSIVQRR